MDVRSNRFVQNLAKPVLTHTSARFLTSCGPVNAYLQGNMHRRRSTSVSPGRVLAVTTGTVRSNPPVHKHRPHCSRYRYTLYNGRPD